MKKKVAFFVVAALVLSLLIALTVLAIIDSKNKPEDYLIEPMNQTVLNFENVVGKREVIFEDIKTVSIGDDKENEVIKYSYKYKSKNGKNDAKIYANMICRKGFLPFTDYDFSKAEANYLFIKVIDDESYMMNALIYNPDSVEVVFWVAKGKVTEDILTDLEKEVFETYADLLP